MKKKDKPKKIDPIEKRVNVRVWRLKSSLIFIPLLGLVGVIPVNSGWLIFAKVILLLYIVPFWFYSFREKWQLSLGKYSFQARQLLPRPFTFFTKHYVIPLKKMEGITVGPKAFNGVLLVGIFIASNLGINFLKNGLLDNEVDLPDTLDAFFILMKGITFMPFLANIATTLELWTFELIGYVQKEVQVTIGIAFLVIGLLLVIITLPRRQFLRVRVRYGPDFYLFAGVPKKFWNALYERLYQEEEFIKSPSQYKKLDFPWLKGEEIETVADLEQTIYYHLIISIFAIYAGVIRLWERIETLGTDFFTTAADNHVFWWIIVAIIDILIAFLAVRFSKKKNEMIITNKRILFAVEEPDISGSFGRRLYTMSDIKRDDVAGFEFRKMKVFSIGYVFASVIVTYLLISYWIELPWLIRIVFIILVLALFAFVNQTYLEFKLKTRGYEVWKLRHQLSNPYTTMRELIGEENKVFNILFPNRLEEKEVVETVRVIRRSTKQREVGVQDKEKKNLSLSIDELLFEDEEIMYETNVSRKVPRRILTLTFSTLLILANAMIAAVPIIMVLSMVELTRFELLASFLFALIILAVIIMIISLWVKYFSLYKASLILTDKRIFFQDRKAPNTLLYLLGVNFDTSITESLRDQIHSTYTSRQFNQELSFKSFIRHSIRYIFFATIAGLGIAGLSLHESIPDVFGLNGLIIELIMLITFITGLLSAWHGGNAFVELVRGWPRRIYHAKGVGVHFEVPFASKEAAESSNYVIWAGLKKELKK